MKKYSRVKTLVSAFYVTVPVMLGYLFIGFAFGMLLEQKGYGFFWAVLMSVCVYAGSMQFVTINFLSGGFSLITIALMTLMINSRHIFYGLTMLERFKGIKKTKKLYMIFALTDETYALLCSHKVPIDVDKSKFLFFISLLNQIYWVSGSLIGSVASSFLVFDSTGIDFAMTALFIVILIEQLRASSNFLPMLFGAGSALACLAVFGETAFMLPAMIITVAVLILMRRQIEKTIKKAAPGGKV